MATVSNLSRAQKLDVAKAILSRLVAHAQKGPKEDALDAYIPLLERDESRLGTHVDGKATANASRKAQLLRLEIADSDVDTWLRHHENFVSVEANRRIGPHVEAAEALREAAFPHGTSYVDAFIPDENRLCRDAIAAIRAPEHGPTVLSIKLPPEWTAAWEAALNESDAAFAEVQKSREAQSSHVDEGLSAEDDFVEHMVRLRRYLGSRAPRADKAMQAESQELIQPLLDALKKLDVERAARATRRNRNHDA